MSEPLFQRSAVGWMLGLGIPSFGLALVLLLFSPELADVQSSSADSYSASSLGHHALVRLLRKLQVPVLVSRHAPADRAYEGGALVLAEPRFTDSAAPGFQKLQEILEQPLDMMLILPKRIGVPNQFKPSWVEEVRLLPQSTVQTIYDATGLEGQVALREQPCPAWTGDAWTAKPSLDQPQVLRSSELSPLIACGEDILVGELVDSEQETRLVVLTDPDLLATHGLGRGENALFAVQLFDDFRQGRSLVLDETLHGHVRIPKPWWELMRFPAVLVLIQVLLLLAVLLVSASGRFGSPLPEEERLKPGKEFLIENIAALLRFGGHSAQTLQRYLDDAVAEVAQKLHAPPEASARPLEEWLERAGQRRGLKENPAQLRNAIADWIGNGRSRSTELLSLARRIHRWKQEMLHGPR